MISKVIKLKQRILRKIFPTNKNLIVREIKCKSLLNKSQLAEYCMNCYIGCEHACKYCYADSITRKFSPHEEAWGEFVDVKVNAPEVLKKEIKRKKKGKIFISSLCDPYQPLEEKYELTRKCLEILLKHQFPIIIQTKSSLVLRDLDLLKKFKSCEVGFTITSLNEKVRKDFEPNSSPVKEKLEAIKVLRENGIFVYVFLGPVLPYLSDENLEEYFEKIVKLNVNEIWVDKLNLKRGVWESVSSVLERNYPELLEKWKKVVLFENNYWEELKEKIRRIGESKGVKCIFCF
ncbi:MAG: radical SAM protein [Candidatus Aenigmatarchaeota archaeon]